MPTLSKQALRPAVFPFLDYSRYAYSLGVASGGRVWLSGHTASRFDEASGRVSVTGPLAEQAAIATAKQGLILESAGLGFANAIKLTDYVTPAGRDAYAELAGERRRLFGDQPPAVSTVVVDSLLRPDALIETELVAVAQPPVRFGTGAGLDGVPTAAAVQTGDLLYCAAVLPLEPDSGAVVAGGLLPQIKQLYRSAEAVLREAGFAMSDVVRTVEFIAAAALPEYRDTWRVRAQYFGEPGAAHVAATGIPMSELAQPGALIQVEFTASRAEKRVLNPGWERYQRLTYCPAVQAGDYIFLSGQLALNPETGALESPGDVLGQARYVYENIRQTLAAAGLGLNDIVKTTEYITPQALHDYRATAGLRRELFDEPYPAATGVVCAALLRPEALIEVDCVAVT